MIAGGSWMIGCLLLAQAADNPARPEQRPPRLVPKRTAPAATFDAPRDEGIDAEDSRSVRGTYPAEPAERQPERTLEELDPARRERSGMERVGGGPRSCARRNSWPKRSTARPTGGSRGGRSRWLTCWPGPKVATRSGQP